MLFLKCCPYHDFCLMVGIFFSQPPGLLAITIETVGQTNQPIILLISSLDYADKTSPLNRNNISLYIIINIYSCVCLCMFAHACVCVCVRVCVCVCVCG